MLRCQNVIFKDQFFRLKMWRHGISIQNTNVTFEKRPWAKLVYFCSELLVVHTKLYKMLDTFGKLVASVVLAIHKSYCLQ